MAIMERLPQVETDNLKLRGNNYAGSSLEKSIWGDPNPNTARLIEEVFRQGMIVGDFPCGDGRYANTILNTGVARYVGIDYDEEGLDKLCSVISPKHFKRVDRVKLDLTEPFPFGDESFDGILTVGTLHLFNPQQVEEQIFPELQRVLKRGGHIIFNFASKIERVNWITGEPERFDGEHPWSTRQVDRLIRRSFRRNKFDITDEVRSRPRDPQIFDHANPPYTWNAATTIVHAYKL